MEETTKAVEERFLEMLQLYPGGQSGKVGNWYCVITKYIEIPMLQNKWKSHSIIQKAESLGNIHDYLC